MLNHAIDNLTPADEDVFLTHGMVGFLRTWGNSVCYLGALDTSRGYNMHHHGESPVTFFDGLLAQQFNALCLKLSGVPNGDRWYPETVGNIRCAKPAPCSNGAARLGILIRARILENRARRVLQSVEATAHV